jgi:hypothetical protein
VSVPLNAVSIPGQIKKIRASIQLYDVEGTFINGLGLSLLSTDIMDSTTTFINALRTLLSQPVIAQLSAIGMPLTFLLLTQGTVSRGIRLKNLIAFSRLQEQITSQLKDSDTSREIRKAIQTFLESTIGTEAQLKDHQAAILERHTNAKVVSLLKELDQWIQEHETISQQDIGHLLQVFEEIPQLLKKDKHVQEINLVSFFLKISAMLAFYTSIPSVVPFLALAAGFSGRLLAQAYQDFA